jgi:hypothetical protein
MFCDSCEESSDHLYDLTRLAEFRDIVRRLNYRKVCQICYDDLYEEAKEQQQPIQDDRRSETRYPLKLRIDVQGIDREGQRFSEQTFTEDVSSTGARVVVRNDVEPGSVLNLHIPDLNFEAAVIIELMWRDGATRHAGLKLVEANEGWANLISEQSRVGKQRI